jgi:hypothetical protein
MRLKDRILNIMTSVEDGIQRNSGLIPARGKRLILCRNLSEQFWVPYSLLFNGYGGSFPGNKAAEA